MRINVVYAVPNTSRKYGEWHDGFTAAMNIVATHHEVQWLNVHPDSSSPEEAPSQILSADVVVVKSDWGWIPDQVATKAALQSHLRPLMILAISGSSDPPTEEWLRYDGLLYETSWYGRKVSAHPNSVQAFGIDTSVMRELNSVERDIDWLMVGRPASFKKPTELIHRAGSRMLVGEIHGHEEVVSALRSGGVEVLDFVGYEELADIYRRTKTLVVAASLNGGGERAILEARACGAHVELVGDNPKLQSLLEGEVPDERAYADAILFSIGEATRSPVGEDARARAHRIWQRGMRRRRALSVLRVLASGLRRVARGLLRRMRRVFT